MKVSYHHGMFDSILRIECCLCGETQRKKILVEGLGISIGKNILKLLGRPHGFKFKNESVSETEE